MSKLTKRQKIIFDFIRSQNGAGTQDIKAHTEKIFDESFSRITIIRDIDFLLKDKLIRKEGKGRGVLYLEVLKNKLFRYFDIKEYFEKNTDKRSVAYPNFNFDVFENLKNLFSREEIIDLEKMNAKYRKRTSAISGVILKKELERLTIELSWKSSQIEGNTYSLIDTEILIKEHKEAEGHKKEEAIMILNHKKALDYIFSNRDLFKNLNVRKVEDVHHLIVEEMNVSTGIRKNLVGITGTKYRPLDNEYQIKEALEKAIQAVENLKHPLEKALVIILMISYIQPFEDGNKRTARILGNAVLMAHNFCPLSYRSVDEADYKKAMLIFYEQNSALFFKELFVEQFKFSLVNYFQE